MKIIILINCLLVLSVTAFSQQINTQSTLTKQEYLLKSKHQKTGAWILLGGGAVLTIVGFAVGLNDAAETIVYAFAGQNKINTTGVALFSVGVISMAGSIPFFIASGKNKRKKHEFVF